MVLGNTPKCGQTALAWDRSHHKYFSLVAVVFCAQFSRRQLTEGIRRRVAVVAVMSALASCGRPATSLITGGAGRRTNVDLDWHPSAARRKAVGKLFTQVARLLMPY
jgi:hypothetical protein